MKRWIRMISVAIILSVVFQVSTVVAGDVQTVVAEAKAHVDTAAALLLEKNYDAAAAELSAAVTLSPTPGALLQLAEIYVILHRFSEATASLSQLERDFADVLSDVWRSRIAEVQTKIPPEAADPPPPVEVAEVPPSILSPPAEGTPPPISTMTTIKFNGVQPGLTLHVKEAGGIGGPYRPLCTAPCEAQLPSGSYNLALNIEGYRLARISGQANFTAAEVQLTGTYRSRKGARVTGAALLGVFAAFGTALVVMGVVFDLDDDGIVPFSMGLLSYGVAFGAGFPLLFAKPRGTVTQQ